MSEGEKVNWTEDQLIARDREVFGIDTTARLTEMGCDAPVVTDLMPEWMIEAECTRLLEQDGWRALRTDPVSDRGRGKGFGEVSMADHQFTRPALPETARAEGWCQLLYVEFKAGRNRATKGQLAWHAKERARGFQTWIANEDFPATIEGFREHYAKSGLMRRERWW